MVDLAHGASRSREAMSGECGGCTFCGVCGDMIVVLSSMLGMAISTFCGLRGSRANASAELQKDIDKASTAVQRAALEACYFHTNKGVPSGSENVLAKYTEEAS